MDIKTTVFEICKNKNRVEFISVFLRNHNIPHNIIEYKIGINIEVIFEGENRNEEIIFIAHHDIYQNIEEGANDNTSSVAVLLNICKFLYINKPYHTVKIVFSDKEEIIGAMLSNKKNEDLFLKIIENIGSFQYFKKYKFIENIVAVFILELSGIGDCIYFAENSGNIICDNKLNYFLTDILKNKKLKYLKIPINYSDMLSVSIFKLRGTVIGAIPYYEGLKYLEKYSNNMSGENYVPHIWKKNHTNHDDVFSIQEKALNLVYNFVIDIIINIKLFKNI